MTPSVYFITGTDTNAGKTVVAALLTRHLSATGACVVALKPICAGGRSDARQLRAASGHALTLDEVNPWHFCAPLAPLLAARLERRSVTLARVLAHARRIRLRFACVIVEGAGGLLSPLGERFDSRDLITALRAVPVVVCPNRLGAINQVRLALAALPRRTAARTQIVLRSDARPDGAARTNPGLLAELFGRERVRTLPWLKFPGQPDRALADRAVRKTVRALAKALAAAAGPRL